MNLPLPTHVIHNESASVIRKRKKRTDVCAIKLSCIKSCSIEAVNDGGYFYFVVETDVPSTWEVEEQQDGNLILTISKATTVFNFHPSMVWNFLMSPCHDQTVGRIFFSQIKGLRFTANQQIDMEEEAYFVTKQFTSNTSAEYRLSKVVLDIL